MSKPKYISLLITILFVLLNIYLAKKSRDYIWKLTLELEQKSRELGKLEAQCEHLDQVIESLHYRKELKK